MLAGPDGIHESFLPAPAAHHAPRLWPAETLAVPSPSERNTKLTSGWQGVENEAEGMFSESYCTCWLTGRLRSPGQIGGEELGGNACANGAKLQKPKLSRRARKRRVREQLYHNIRNDPRLRAALAGYNAW